MRSSKGFTLIELLIVVAIIAILAAIAVPNFLEAQTRSKVTRVKADMHSLRTAIESFYVDHNAAPPCYRYYVSDDKLTAQKSTQAPAMYFLQVQWTDNPGGALGEGCGAWLTTPIAYMGAIPLDPFVSAYPHGKEMVGWGKGIKSAGALYGMRFGGGVVSAYSKASGAVTYPDVGYFMVSTGPDLILDSLLDANLPPLGTPARFGYLSYDPTNGTVSQGDVLCLGKGVGFPAGI
jgi:prepilin-type N-terminal cleavage/methylation domain-containing protein